MSQRHVVVDGSNIATEGRSLPSLAQLDDAVREFRREFPDDQITVVVDATFGHRIDESEVEAFKEAEAHGEVVSPPAGAIGRGDAFLLRIAERVGATVLSNDSFQEFHGEHEWLFEKGRLIGGKPVPGIGWIFTPRTPVRGPKSREAVKVAKRAKKAAASGEPEFASLEEEVAARRSRGRRPPAKEAAKPPAKPPAKAAPKKVESAIAMATEEAVTPEVAASRRRRRRRSGGSAPPAEPLNQPLAFIEFVSAHRLGSEVTGVVDRFSSHGAFVTVDGAACYIPLSAMGDPPPRAARDVLNRGEERTFVVQALDPPRRGIELALPGFAHVAATPTEETVEEEIAAGHHLDGAPEDATVARAVRKKKAAPDGPARGSRRGRRGAVVGAGADAGSGSGSGSGSGVGEAAGDVAPQEEPAVRAATRATTKKAAAKRTAATAAKKTAKGTAKKAAGAPAAKKTAAATTPAPDATAEAPAKAGTRRAAGAGAKKAAAVKPTTVKTTGVKKAAVKKAATTTAKATAPKPAPATRSAATKAAATKAAATRSAATKAAATKAPSAKKAPAKKAAAKETPAKKAPRTEAAAKAQPAKKTGATKPAAKKTPAPKSAAKKAPPAR